MLTPPTVETIDDDGLLTAPKIATLKLNAEWVVLSACNTGPVTALLTAGLSGLARAVFYASARSRLISHWSLPSKPTVGLKVAFIRPTMTSAAARQVLVLGALVMGSPIIVRRHLRQQR
jgi:CHAT domain-containing protein